MPILTIDSNTLATLKNHANGGDKTAIALTQILDKVLAVELSAAAEAANAIVVSGQVKEMDGTLKPGVRDVLVETTATATKGFATVVTGTAKLGNGSNKVWLQTTASGAFSVSVANDTAEDNLVRVTLDDGSVEFLKITFA